MTWVAVFQQKLIRRYLLWNPEFKLLLSLFCRGQRSADCRSGGGEPLRANDGGVWSAVRLQRSSHHQHAGHQQQHPAADCESLSCQLMASASKSVLNTDSNEKELKANESILKKFSLVCGWRWSSCQASITEPSYTPLFILRKAVHVL